MKSGRGIAAASRAVLGAILGGACLTTSLAALAIVSPAFAQTQAVDASNEIAAALYAASATQAAAERTADARLRAAQAEITRLRAQGASGRAALAAAQERFIAELAAKDRAYAQEIAVFRSAVTDIASTPEGAAILAQRHPGNLRQARTLLLELIQRRNAAEQRASAIRQAANIRAGAAIALDDRAKGEATAEEVIALFVEATRLDPSMPWDWVELGRLYRDTDNLPLARAAAERATQTAYDSRTQGIALFELGSVQRAVGEFDAARATFASLIALNQETLQMDPGSADAEYDLAISYGILGHLYKDLGKPQSAKENFENCLSIVQRLSARIPENREFRKALATGLVNVGDSIVVNNATSALDLYRESLQIRAEIADQNPQSTTLARDLATSYQRIGNALSGLGDLPGARAKYLESLTVYQRIADQDPNCAACQRDLVSALNRIATVALDSGDSIEAREKWERCIQIVEALRLRAPENAEWPRSSAMLRLQLARVEGVDAPGQLYIAYQLVKGLEASGRLAPRDQPLLEFLSKMFEPRPSQGGRQ